MLIVRAENESEIGRSCSLTRGTPTASYSFKSVHRWDIFINATVVSSAPWG